jgi:23S rRNA pseudouridine1911/1915/1917 synthase
LKTIRLDQYLASQHKQYSRTQIKKLIDDGFVLVNGETRKPSFLLHGGENIEMVRRAPEIPKAEAEEIPLDILYEDDALMVINKAAGMVVHPAPGHYKGTLVSAVLHHLAGERLRASPEPPQAFSDGVNPIRERDPFRPGIVHRLDKGTTGLIIVAKTDVAQRAMMNQFKDRKVEKTYQALVFGNFKQKAGTIDKAIGRDTQHRRKFSSRTRFARSAVTHWDLARSFKGLSLLKIRLETGRTHQIRVHLSENHHPIVGDTVYGAKSFLSSIKQEDTASLLESLTRPMLHAWRLSFRHPVSSETVAFEAPLPEDFRSVLESAESL